MKYANELYLGKKARMIQTTLVEELAGDIFRRDLFFVLLSDHPHDLLEVVEAGKLQDPVFARCTNSEKINIVGIAVTKEEALDLMNFIVLDVYKKTGGFEIKTFFSFA